MGWGTGTLLRAQNMWLPFGCITWVCGPRLAGLFASLRTSKCIIRKKGTPYKESTCRSTGRTHRGTRSGLCSENATAAGQVPPRARAPWGHGNLGTEIPGKERPHQLLSQKCHNTQQLRWSLPPGGLARGCRSQRHRASRCWGEGQSALCDLLLVLERIKRPHVLGNKCSSSLSDSEV